MLRDARIYGLLRISYAVCVILTWINLWPRRHDFISNTGILDRSLLFHHDGLKPSIFRYFDSELFVTAVMLIALFFALSLLVGFYSRLSMIVVYIWAVSYWAKLGGACYSVDSFIRTLGFILLISPIGDAWSFKRKHKAMVPAYGLYLMQWQMALMYLTASISKFSDPFWRNGELISYFFLSHFSLLQSPIWADLVWLSKILTWGTLVIEFTLPFLLFFRRTRILGFVLGWGLHAIIGLGSTVPLLSLITMAGYFCFLDNHDIRRLSERLYNVGRLCKNCARNVLKSTQFLHI